MELELFQLSINEKGVLLPNSAFDSPIDSSAAGDDPELVFPVFFQVLSEWVGSAQGCPSLNSVDMP